MDRYRRGHPSNPIQGPVSRKSRELFGPEKPFVKVRPAYSVKLVFSYVVKGIKIKVTAKFRAPRRLRFKDTERIMSPEIRPKSFGTFEKQAPGLKSFTKSFFWRESGFLFKMNKNITDLKRMSYLQKPIKGLTRIFVRCNEMKCSSYANSSVTCGIRFFI